MFLAVKTPIYDAVAPIEFVFFPIDAVISVVQMMRSGTQIEVLMVGREGITGEQALLDGSIASARSWCQVPGDAYRIALRDLRDLMDRFPDFRKAVDRYLSAQIDALAQTVACNRLHRVDQRCARWLLRTRDRAGRDEFPLTHEALASMLGVRRAGVSVAAAALQQAGTIRDVRGRVTIVDPAGLQAAACECYGAISDAFRRRDLAA